MTFVRPDIVDDTTPDAAALAERRRHRRFAVTLSARVHHAERCYRTRILDVSDGGLLLSPIAALCASEHETIDVESLPIGNVRVRIVGLSPIGIHAQVEEATGGYHDAVRRLASLTQTWTQAPR